MQWNSNSQPLCLQTNAEPFSQTGQVMTLCCEYLSLPHSEILILSNNDNGNKIIIIIIIIREIKKLTF